MDFLDVFKKDDEEEVELKPGESQSYSYSGPGVNQDNSSDEGSTSKSSEEASLFPGLQGGSDKDKSSSGSRKKSDINRIENKLDKILKQNKMILEKLENDDSSSGGNEVW